MKFGSREVDGRTVLAVVFAGVAGLTMIDSYRDRELSQARENLLVAQKKLIGTQRGYIDLLKCENLVLERSIHEPDHLPELKGCYKK